MRHYVNTSMQKAGISDIVIAYISGRTKISQNAVYDHRTREDKMAQIAELRGGGEYDSTEINVITSEEYTQKTNRIASDMGAGICAQDLNVSPCKHLNVYEQHCVGCSKANFCKGNKQAIADMHKDIGIQKLRLEEIYKKNDIHRNILSQKQFVMEMENLTHYEALLTLMTDPSINDGMLIRWVGDKKIFRITDINTLSYEDRKVELPDIQKMLDKCIAESAPKKEPELHMSELDKLLESTGIDA